SAVESSFRGSVGGEEWSEEDVSLDASAVDFAGDESVEDGADAADFLDGFVGDVNDCVHAYILVHGWGGTPAFIERIALGVLLKTETPCGKRKISIPWGECGVFLENVSAWERSMRLAFCVCVTLLSVTM